MARSVVVSAPSHVHVGNVDMHGGVGRLYGTLGFALQEPRLVVRVWLSGSFEAEGPRSGECLRFARAACEMAGCKGLKVRVEREIPAHVGLGSTTPLALSIALAASVLTGSRIDFEEYALSVGRSRVSGLGFHAFMHGGFIVDGGYPSERKGSEVPPLIFRAIIPPRVAVVVALPTALASKVAEVKAREDEVLESMPPMDERVAAANARLVLMGILPAMAKGRFEEAARLLHKLNSGLGDYWAPRQEGRYCCREVEGLVEVLLNAGGWCACQSSWGPTVYSLTDYKQAEAVAAAAREYLSRIGGGRVWVTRVDNRGAYYTIEGD